MVNYYDDTRIFIISEINLRVFIIVDLKMMINHLCMRYKHNT